MKRYGRAAVEAARTFARVWGGPEPGPAAARPMLGLALGGGFARGVAHAGVLRVLERERIPVGAIAGVSAGAVVAACYAAGADSHELEKIARELKLSHLAAWRVGRLGLMRTDRMEAFLRRVLAVHHFEQMRIPLSVVATDLSTGEPVIFREGEVFHPVRASCSYPGLFHPVRHEGRLLVDGAISMEVPAQALPEDPRLRVVSVVLPAPREQAPDSAFGVVQRCFQILTRRGEHHWRRESDLVIEPHVHGVRWDGFTQFQALIEAGMAAAEAALPRIRRLLAAGSPEWLAPRASRRVSGAPGYL